MKWLLFSSAFLIYSSIILCQDIVFPNDEELTHVSGNKPMITERIPVSIPGHCPENMLLYPSDGNKLTWVCDCRPRFLYFPLNDTCYEAYKQGPCPPQHYVILPEGEAVPQCVKNPCLEDGLVKYNNVCYPLRTIGGPCAPAVIGVNATNFKLECIPTDIAPFIIINVPDRGGCPPGSRRTTFGVCKPKV
ncbi:PREDICTED: uncharacterized protein LOC106793926 [Polistes canadensis]|uniref:uncharacterized protein LOC106793926 n=1 Tax=Polistes canadensis TaxID=91411 RepID=UPI000718D2E0|nr:PREDICTED: uncharacterized protein LOC106793926 [Polistes canadensis]KAI4484840.1 hypothetical protein M0804_007406 [Polistes exclamans]